MSPGAPRRRMPVWERLLSYTLVLIALGAIVTVAGASIFDAVECSGADFEGECDLAMLIGAFYGFVAVIIAAVVIVVVEVVIVVHRRINRRRGVPAREN